MNLVGANNTILGASLYSTVLFKEFPISAFDSRVVSQFPPGEGKVVDPEMFREVDPICSWYSPQYNFADGTVVVIDEDNLAESVEGDGPAMNEEYIMEYYQEQKYY
ncbi:hypothetical protein [Bacillus cereus group sp. BfR-BA-01349]|uniref:hypothetical protein n=1 Tax=Bacillus cereus group sp. BfR-BA-01349 TaxID=2920312 RepID=UPI001F575089